MVNSHGCFNEFTVVRRRHCFTLWNGTIENWVEVGKKKILSVVRVEIWKSITEFLFRSKWNENSMWFVSVEKFIFMFSKCCCPRIRVIFSHERIARKYWKLSDTIFPFLTILNIHEWTRPQELWAFKKENVLFENVKANK